MKKIMIIEDDDAICNELSELLENNNYKPIILRNFKNSLNEIIESSPDLILLDINIPYINGEKLEEDYIRSEVVTGVQEEEYADVVVPEGTIYVMGDNREQSKDSRSFGCIPYDRVNGYLVCRIWPLNKIGAVK